MLQMHLHRCHVLILFVIFIRIYVARTSYIYQNLISSRITQQGQGERESREVMAHDISSHLLTVTPVQRNLTP